MFFKDFDVFDLKLLESFGIDFWIGLGVVLGPKLKPKSTKDASKRVSKTRCDFERILHGSWIDLGSILEAKLGAIWPQNLTYLGCLGCLILSYLVLQNPT